MPQLTLGEGWTPAVRARCVDLCADDGDPPCWALAGDDAHPNTPNPLVPCAECAPVMTATERAMARHALGLDNPRANRRSYRNRYHASAGGDKWAAWWAMKFKGWALVRHAPGRLIEFGLTTEGARLALDPGETLCPEDFPLA